MVMEIYRKATINFVGIFPVKKCKLSSVTVNIHPAQHMVIKLHFSDKLNNCLGKRSLKPKLAESEKHH